MSFIKKSKQRTDRSNAECLEAIATVIKADKLTNEQLNKLVNLMEDDAKLKKALIFL